ncbi:MAG: hypothetical protein QM666_01235 [Acinetobacter sp.]
MNFRTLDKLSHYGGWLSSVAFWGTMIYLLYHNFVNDTRFRIEYLILIFVIKLIFQNVFAFKSLWLSFKKFEQKSRDEVIARGLYKLKDLKRMKYCAWLMGIIFTIGFIICKYEEWKYGTPVPWRSLIIFLLLTVVSLYSHVLIMLELFLRQYNSQKKQQESDF